MKLRKGDKVLVVAGKDKGKIEKIEKVYPKENKVLVSGVNQYKRHFKGRAQNQKSEIITLTKPLPVAAVSLICPKCNKVTRIGFKMGVDKSKEKAEKLRICRKCGKVI